MSKKLLFVYNAKSGKARIKTYLAQIIDIFINAGYRVETYQTQCPMDAGKKIEADGHEFNLIVCSGGDGTLNEVVSGVMKLENSPTIGYIPSGSTNDFGKTIGLYKNMLKSANIAVNGTPMDIDIGQFGADRNFVYIAAFGIFTDVSYQTSQNMKNVLGHQAYIIEGIKSLSTVRAYKMKVEYEGGTFEDEFIYGMISNSESAGGFKGITGKDVILNDGIYEGTFIRKPKSPFELSSIVNSLLAGKNKSDAIYNFKTSKCRIMSEEPVSWVLDGEFGGMKEDVEITNLKSVVKIMTNGNAK
ncbi:MAG: YegS/Rv2252/BmrU family lipid kinase [Clostridiales bacterium]|nr:YegS/Rv2252/BmrU family lipid kinase [Clostridiales bacterium]